MTVARAVTDATARLRQAGIADPRREARLLVVLATGLDAAALLRDPDRQLRRNEAGRLEPLLARRAGGEPFSRLAGTREFWSLPFRLGPETLDPRPESETVIEGVLAALPDLCAPLRLLDLGTGSGCLLLALLSELPTSHGVGIDLSRAACRIARENAARLHLDARADFVVGDWAEAVSGRFDVIVANPPYIPENDIERLPPEVARFDPHRALAGGADGLAAYRRIAPALARLLGSDGVAAVEVGHGQARAVAGLFAESGLELVTIRRDLAGVDRCVLARARVFVGPAQKKVSIRRRRH